MLVQRAFGRSAAACSFGARSLRGRRYPSFVAGLDPKVTAELYALIDQLNKKDGITIIMVSHDKAAIRYASHVLHVKSDCHFFGTAQEYHDSPSGCIFCGKKEDDNA